MNRQILCGLILTATAALLCGGDNALAARTAHEQLIVFVQPGKSAVDDFFQAEQLPAIRAVANGMGVAVHVYPIDDGAPPEVALTPLMVYQNHRGRSIYQGRTTTPDRIRIFIRTSRFVPQGSDPLRREQIPVWTIGRERIWAPIKVASVTGTPPPGYDDDTFRQEALQAIASGFTKFKLRQAAALGRADRGFYMDFYPWRAADGTLFLSLALYSQFHCKEPIFEKKETPLTGPWSKRRHLFKQAAALLEAQVAAHIQHPESGDAFDAVAANIAVLRWDQIGYPLPPAPPSRKTDVTSNTQLTRGWVLVASDPDAPPMIQFRFAAPLDNYAGEVKSGHGILTLPPSLVLDSAQGSVEIDTRSAITMGDPVLDEAIQGSMLLGARKHPRASFAIESIDSDSQPIAYGQLSPARINGTLVLKGKSMPLAVPAEFEPAIGADGRPRLIVRAAFQIDLRAFEIEGADGPAPARHTLLFDVNLPFAPSPPE